MRRSPPRIAMRRRWPPIFDPTFNHSARLSLHSAAERCRARRWRMWSARESRYQRRVRLSLRRSCGV
jgi:hypothetical protein